LKGGDNRKLYVQPSEKSTDKKRTYSEQVSRLPNYNFEEAKSLTTEMNVTKLIKENQQRRGHSLMTEALKKQLPPLGKTAQTEPDEIIVQVKYFCPFNRWTWYAFEFDGRDIFYGLVYGDFTEYGSFSLTELETIRMPFGYPAVERDLYFEPTSLEEVKAEHRQLGYPGF